MMDAGSLQDRTYSLLEASQVSRAESIRLRNNRDQVDSRAQSLHDLNIQRFQCVPSRADEVQAGVNTEINLVDTTGLLLLQHVGLMLIIQELDDWHPGIAVVDIVSEARCINDGETHYQLLLTAKSKISCCGYVPLKNFSSNSAFVISISTVLSTCFACLRLWSA
jgi:hypothetical protein